MFVAALALRNNKNLKQKLEHSSLKEFLDYMLDISEIPQSIRNDKSFEELTLIFKNDYQLLKSYIYSQKAPLDCPISAFGGIEDPLTSQQQLKEWSQHTNNTFKLQMLPGKHLFLKSDKKLLLENISQELTAYL